MKKRFLIPVFVFIGFLISAFTTQAFASFSATIAPATKVIELKRGETYRYDIAVTNNEDDADEQYFKMRVVEFVYDETGARAFIETEEIADPRQALSTWVSVPATQKNIGNQPLKFFVDISIPNDAAYGDHMGVIYIAKEEPASTEYTPVAVRGRLASTLIIKVIGGETVAKTGQASAFAIQVRERARNTATLTYEFQNTSREFYQIETIVDIFNEKEDSKPIKTVNSSTRVFPNVKKQIQVPLGDLGDDFGEKEYYSQIRVQEQAALVKNPILFAKFEQPFYYNLPVRDEALAISAPTIIEKEVQVVQPLVAVVKELGLYVFGFLVVLVILIRVLFFGRTEEKKKKR